MVILPTAGRTDLSNFVRPFYYRGRSAGGQQALMDGPGALDRFTVTGSGTTRYVMDGCPSTENEPISISGVASASEGPCNPGACSPLPLFAC